MIQSSDWLITLILTSDWLITLILTSDWLPDHPPRPQPVLQPDLRDGAAAGGHEGHLGGARRHGPGQVADTIVKR